MYYFFIVSGVALYYWGRSIVSNHKIWSIILKIIGVISFVGAVIPLIIIPTMNLVFEDNQTAEMLFITFILSLIGIVPGTFLTVKGLNPVNKYRFLKYFGYLLLFLGVSFLLLGSLLAIVFNGPGIGHIILFIISLVATVTAFVLGKKDLIFVLFGVIWTFFTIYIGFAALANF